MGLKKYIIGTLILLILSGIVGYNLSSEIFTLKIVELGINKELPLYVWFVLPPFFLFLATLLHIIFYGTKGYLERNATKKDIAKLGIILNDKLLEKESNLALKTPELREFADACSELMVRLPKERSITSPLVSKTAQIIRDIENGKYIPAKELKLPLENKWNQLNVRNRVTEDHNFGTEVLRNPSNYTQELIEYSFGILANEKPIDYIIKLLGGYPLSHGMLLQLFSKDAEQLLLTNSEIIENLKNNTLSTSEIIHIAKEYQKTMSPERLLGLFEDIAAQYESFLSSYLYLLFAYQMLDKAREILVNSQKNEFIVYKALLDLKDCGKYSYNIEDFIDA